MAKLAADPVLAGKAKRTQEMPVHPKLDSKTKWAQSTIPLTNELRKNLNRIADGAAKNSAKKNKQLKNYVSVVEREVSEEWQGAARSKATPNDAMNTSSLAANALPISCSSLRSLLTTPLSHRPSSALGYGRSRSPARTCRNSS